MFLSRLNEISGGCEKIVKVANAFLRAKLEENCELLRQDNSHRLTQSILSRHCRLFCLLSFKYFATRGKISYEQLTVHCVGCLLFNVSLVQFYEQTYFFLWNNQKTFFWYILGYSLVLTGDIRSPNVFRPNGCKQKYLMD